MSLFNTHDQISVNEPLHQEHIGIVINNDDPKNLCRIQVVIPGILDIDNDLWFTRQATNFPGIVYCTPRLGQRVKVWFKNGSITKGVYGTDYVHITPQSNLFKPGDYGFADINSNYWRVRGRTTTYSTGSFNLEGNLTVTGNVSCGTGYTGSFSAGDGSIITVENGIVTDVTLI